MDGCFALRARWILPVEGPAIRDGYVAIAGGRLEAVGKRRPDGPVEDLGDAVLLPGLVNAHTHLEFSALAAPLGTPGIALPEWIRLVISQRKGARSEARAAIAAGIAESLDHGVTTIGEIATAPAGDYPAADAAPEMVLFQEAIGFSAARVASVFEDVQRRFLDGGERAGLSPHAPYTAHPQLVERIVALAAAHEAPAAMHLAESREELELLGRGGGPFRDLLDERSMWDAGAIAAGTRPMDYLRALAKAPRSLVIHGNYLDAEEMAYVGERRATMSVVFCPRTHGYFGHDPYPLAAMQTRGVRVALGTDSRASNPDLDLRRDLSAAAALAPELDPAEIVRMATLAGAEALGLSSKVGSLAAGKQADLVALPCDPAATEPYAAVLGDGPPVGVWLRGRRVRY